MHQQQNFFKNIMGKGETATSQAISPFPTMFSTQSDISIPIRPYFDIISLVAFELEEPKVSISGKGLKKMIGQKTWLLLETHFLLMVKSRIFEHIWIISL